MHKIKERTQKERKKNSIFNLTKMYNRIIHVHNSLSPKLPSQKLHFSSKLFTILATWLLLQDCNSPYVSAMYFTSHTPVLISGIFIAIHISCYYSHLLIYQTVCNIQNGLNQSMYAVSGSPGSHNFTHNIGLEPRMKVVTFTILLKCWSKNKQTLPALWSNTHTSIYMYINQHKEGRALPDSPECTARNTSRPKPQYKHKIKYPSNVIRH